MDRCAVLTRSWAAFALAAIAYASIPTDARGQAAGCREPNNSYLRACLLNGTITAALSGAEDQDHYRFDVLDSGAQARVELAEAAPGLRVRLLDWGGRGLAESREQAGAARIDATLNVPGTYYLAVDASGTANGGPYRLSVDVMYQAVAPRMLLSRDMVADLSDPLAEGESGTGLVNGQFITQLNRGGTPEIPQIHERRLNLANRSAVGDFVLAVDARLQRATGSAAVRIRFRYQPEAGGGTGYVISLEPFDGRVRLETFDEGQRVPLTNWITHPAARSNFDTARLIVQALGESISVSVNGEQLIQVEDARFPNGYLTIGAATWSEPITATFDNVLVTTPAR
jgi:hypothetical protein